MDFLKNCLYRINGEKAYFLGKVDGINTFKLEVDRKLFCFYFDNDIEKELKEIEKDNIEIYTEKELNDLDIVPNEDIKISVDENKFYAFIFTAKTTFMNSAFCPEGMLDVLFDKKGLIYDENNSYELKKKYRAVNPDYCLINEDNIYRQVDMREDYPDLILEFEKFNKKIFLETSEFKEENKIYLTAKSSESYGGHHKLYNEWINKVSESYINFFKNYKLSLFRRVFEIKKDKIKYFTDELNIKLKDIQLLFDF